MIQQPDLGKKIADLRKAKGLTQEELVDKCNLNVRTLQRIESREVTPRTYTIRLIFEALDFSLEESLNDKGLIQKWLEQFYISFIDLFNLKTNTMKKISILTIILSGIVFGLFAFVLDGKAQDKNKKATKIIKNENSVNQSDLKMKEGNFSCINCFYDNEDLIGYGVKFKKDGVTVRVNLIKLNTSSGEFNAGFIKGVFLSNKVEVEVEREWIDKKMITFEAKDQLEKFEDKIILKGNAKIISPENETIEADQIIMHLE